MLGVRQSGMQALKFARLPEDVELLERARRHAREILDADPNLHRARARADRGGDPPRLRPGRARADPGLVQRFQRRRLAARSAPAPGRSSARITATKMSTSTTAKASAESSWPSRDQHETPPRQAAWRDRPGHPQAEEREAEQVERRAPRHDEQPGAVELRGGTGDHELVADGRDDHPGDQEHVQVGVGVTGQRDAVRGQLEAPLGDPRRVGEVQPPHRRRDREREREGHHAAGVELQVRGGGAGDHDRLAEREDDEQLEALGEVRGLDVPRGGRHRGRPGTR